MAAADRLPAHQVQPGPERYRSGRNGGASKALCPVKSRARGFESHPLRRLGVPGAADPLPYYESVGEVRIRAPHPATSVAIIAPYSEVFVPGQPAQAPVVPDGFPLRETGGFETTIPLRWVGNLELTARVPGCGRVSVECDDRGCR